MPQCFHRPPEPPKEPPRPAPQPTGTASHCTACRTHYLYSRVGLSPPGTHSNAVCCHLPRSLIGSFRAAEFPGVTVAQSRHQQRPVVPRAHPPNPLHKPVFLLQVCPMSTPESAPVHPQAWAGTALLCHHRPPGWEIGDSPPGACSTSTAGQTSKESTGAHLGTPPILRTIRSIPAAH